MRHNRSLPVWALALALGLTFGVLSLTACGSDKTGEAAPAEEASKEAEATKEAEGEQANGEDQAESQDEAVWVVSRSVYSYHAAEMDAETEFQYELDEQGNQTKVTHVTDQDADPYVATNAFDEDGYVVKTAGSLEGEAVQTYSLEKDEQGRLIKSTGSDGTVKELTYDNAGNIAKSVETGSIVGEDTEGNLTNYGTYSATTTYDEAGHVVSILYENNGYYQLTEKAYEYNDAGQVVSVTTTTSSGSDADNLEADASGTTTATVEYDDNGNISRVVEEGELYTSATAYEYTLIEHPSLATRLNAHIQDL